MTVKTTGAEFKAFYQDPAIWTDGLYHEEEEIVVDGQVRSLEDDMLALSDIAKVTISGGFVSDEEGRDHGTLEALFRKWKQRQGRRIMVIDIPAGAVDSITKAVLVAGGRVV